jgi:hypothetical protein
VTVSWLAQEVADGKIRWVLAENRGPRDDGRPGANAAMQSWKAVDAGGVTLYDCQNQAGALAAAN